MKKEEIKKNHSASIGLQLTLLGIFTILLFGILYKINTTFITKDTIPPLTQITPQQIIQFGAEPSTVHVGIYIYNFPKFDMAENIFTADLTVWFKFNPRIIPVEKLGKFTFDRSTILYKSQPQLKKEKDNLLFARYTVRVRFSTNLNYDNFPLDDHNVILTLNHYFLSPKDTIFKSYKSDININPKIRIPGWKLVGKSVRTGFIEDKLDPNYKERYTYHPRAIFSLEFSRSGVRHLISILIPLLLVFFIALFTLTFDPYTEASSIIGISVASISALIAQRFVIERMSPSSGHLMLSDKLFILLLIGCCIIFTINIIGKKFTSPYKNLLTILLHLYVIIGFLFLFSSLINL